MKINLNDSVTFTLNRHGLEVLAAQDEKYGLKPGCTAGALGYSHTSNQCTAPLWEVMNIFGPSLFMGAQKNPIEGNVLELKTA